MILSNEWEKQELLNRFLEARKGDLSNTGNVRIGHDQTKWELMEYKKLKEELVRRNQNVETDLVIRDLQTRKSVRKVAQGHKCLMEMQGKETVCL